LSNLLISLLRPEDFMTNLVVAGMAALCGEEAHVGGLSSSIAGLVVLEQRRDVQTGPGAAAIVFLQLWSVFCLSSERD
jgi:hypothetical protein